MMSKHDRIFIAGHRGMVGSAIVRKLRERGYTNLITRTRTELNLVQQADVRNFFESEGIDQVYLAAAKVGGILANSNSPAEFIYQNVLIQANVIHEAYRAGVKRLLFLGSSCIYPRHAPQPIREESLLSGPLEPTNRAYAVAKIAGIEMCASYNRQFDMRFLAAMPTNLYGTGDHYNLQDSHVIPALILKMHEAKLSGANNVTVWGTGAPRREFLCSEDAADACIFLINLPDPQLDRLVAADHSFPVVNVGSGEDLTIRELAELIADVVGFAGKRVFDDSKPDGTPRKLLDITRLTAFGWKSFTPLREGLRITYQDFLDRQKPAPPAGSTVPSGAGLHRAGK